MSARATVLLYALVSYAVAFATIIYLIAFVANLGVPRAIDTAPTDSLGYSLLVDAGLIIMFGIQHSTMARPSFKRWLVSIIPAAAERSTYLLASSLALSLVFIFWRPLGGQIWHLEGIPALALNAVSAIGWLLLFASTMAIDHFELFGLRQAWAYFRGKARQGASFKEPMLYRMVRHPLYLGFLIAFWSTPNMTISHAAFALLFTLYILIGVRFEERDMLQQFGDSYRRYRSQVPMLLPWSQCEAPPKQ